MQTPMWMQILKEKYKSGISNVFLLTGNIGDYAIPGVMLLDYLTKELSDLRMSKIATFNFSEGTVFYKGCLEKDTVKQINKDWNMLLEQLRASKERTAYIIEYPEFLIPRAVNGYLDEATKKRLIDIHKLMNDKSFIMSENLLIFVTEAQSNIHEMFLNSNSRTALINIEFPSVEERLEMIRFLKETTQKKFRWEIEEDKFAKLTAGLSRVHLEDMFLMAEQKGVLERRMIMQRKEELIKKEFGEVIEIFDTDGYHLDLFVGQEHIKEYHREAVIEPILFGDTSIVPKGILYMGPPGTGKTYFARCLAGEANINFVEFKISKILDKYVGEAEKNLEKAFNCFKSLAPVGVFIDEIDQALQRGGENDGNSVNKNIFGMFLSFLSEPENRGKILWIAATNYPNKMDEALKRAGRFDKKIPFFPPSKEERISVFKFHFKKTGFPLDINDYDYLGEVTGGYTQAEIENIVIKTLELAKRKKYEKITDDLVKRAVEYIISAQNTRIQEMINIALNECNDIEFLPNEFKQKVRERLKRGDGREALSS